MNNRETKNVKAFSFSFFFFLFSFFFFLFSFLLSRNVRLAKEFSKTNMILILFFFFKNKNKSYFIKLFQKQIIFYSTYFKKSNLEICTPNKN